MATTDELYDEATRLKDDGDLEGAVEKLKEGLALNEGHVNSHYAMAVYLQRLGQFEDAIRHATRATELEPNDPFAFTQLSVICMRCGRIPEAEAAMAKSREVGH